MNCPTLIEIGDVKR